MTKDKLSELLARGMTAVEIAEHEGVSRQRVYQWLQAFSLPSPERDKRGYVRELSPREYWLYVTLGRKKLPYERVKILVRELFTPDTCPALGIPLEYDHTTPRTENSASLDQILPGQGYVSGNVVVVSWRANRIKNDAKIPELKKIYDFYIQSGLIDTMV